jgi:hypothetical protein
MRSSKQNKADLSSQRGATMVEFAVIAALVFVILFGILEYGLVFLQEHYVADAAREGARTGVRANNYDCFEPATGCVSSRVAKTEETIIEYLDIFYDEDDLDIDVTSDDLDEDSVGGEVLVVSVRAPNFAPGLVSGLLKALPGSSGADADSPSSISSTATMEYEDSSEYAEENAE